MFWGYCFFLGFPRGTFSSSFIFSLGELFPVPLFIELRNPHSYLEACILLNQVERVLSIDKYVMYLSTCLLLIKSNEFGQDNL